MINNLNVEDIYFTNNYKKFSLSPDGSEISMVCYDRGFSVIYLIPSTGGFPKLCLKLESENIFPKWSPDCEWLAWSLDGITCWSVRGEKIKKITNNKNHRIINWSPKGESIAFVEELENKEYLWIASSEGDLLIKILEIPGKIYSANWSHDSKKLVIIMKPFNKNKLENYLIDLDLEEKELIWEENYPLYHIPQVQWFPDNQKFIFSSANEGFTMLWCYDLDSQKVKTFSKGDSEDTHPLISPNGTSVAYTMNFAESGQKVLVLHEINTQERNIIIDMPGINKPVAWYPDNSGILFTHENPQSPADLWSVELDSGIKSRLTYSGYVGLPKKIKLPECKYLDIQNNQYYCQFYYPLDFDDKNKYPVVFWLRDNLEDLNDYGFHPRYSWLANEGYVVAVLSYRGSTNQGIQHMIDGLGQYIVEAAIEDIMESANIIAKYPYVNPNHFAIGGISWGAYLTLMISARYPDHFRCAFSHGAITEWKIQNSKTNKIFYYHELIRKGYVDDPNFFEDISPINHVRNIQRPILITHGIKDKKVPFIQSKKFIEQILPVNRQIQYHFYENEEEWLKDGNNLIHWHNKLLDFLREHLISPSEISM